VFEFDLGFPGQRRDRETGLFYNLKRDAYSPAIGGYTQPEPLGLYGDINLYRYAGSSPLIYFDPDGRQATSVIGGALGGGARGSGLGLPGLIGGAAIGALIPMMCQVTDRDRCERQCDRDYDWDQKQCEWVWKMSGRDNNVLRVCMDRARQTYLDCYRDCAK
jgi:RHS repeat-associated protein